LDPDGGRQAYLSRLGHEVGDVLDEFLGLTLDHEQAGLPGLQAFLAMLESDTPEIKREMEGRIRRGADHDRSCGQGAGGPDRVPGRFGR
jgi:ATP-dependent exoDNAse (exonuclease V) beta subunit